jgi:aspartate ammonia-lyase
MNKQNQPIRLEHDLLGERKIPADAYYGIHTLRAVENFPITGTSIQAYPGLLVAIACVKQACALANLELGFLDQRRANAIIEACENIRRGQLHDQFIVDIIQGGAGTSTNMNANEVIANRALEHLGFPPGAYHELHPLDHVNKSQSTNDVYPTAVKVALHFEIKHLVDAMGILQNEFKTKSDEFEHIIKMGRTQMQDAVPMTLGQEFNAFAIMLSEDRERLLEASQLIQEVNLGATAIGTGINAPAGYAQLAAKYLSELSGVPLVTASNLVEATQDAGAFVQLSGVVKRVAVKLSKTCNDLRLLSSGPRAGLGEINLPRVQAGSSIMPGKVNPVIPEVVNQIAFEVIGNDVTISFAAEAGQLQLNAFEPIIAHKLFDGMLHLRRGITLLAERCVRGITANPEVLRERVENSIGIVTALNSIIGYENASAIADEAYKTGKSVAEIVLAKGLLSKEELDAALSPESLSGCK